MWRVCKDIREFLVQSSQTRSELTNYRCHSDWWSASLLSAPLMCGWWLDSKYVSQVPFSENPYLTNCVTAGPWLWLGCALLPWYSAEWQLGCPTPSNKATMYFRNGCQHWSGRKKTCCISLVCNVCHANVLFTHVESQGRWAETRLEADSHQDSNGSE
mgnify:CR=1 FL=1